MNFRYFLLVALILLTVLNGCKKKDNPTPAPASTPSPSTAWQATSGATSRTIYRFCVSGNSVFGADGGYIFKSTDDGATWNISSAGPHGINAQFVYDVKSIGTSVFASSSNGVYVSTDAGTTWTTTSSGLSGVYVACLATQGSTLLAGTQNGIFASINNASTWSSINNGIPSNTSITGLTSNGTLMLAIGSTTTQNYSLYKSTDGGGNWNVVNNVIPPSAVVYYVFINGNTCFVGTTIGNFISTDSGNTWSSINSLSHPVIGFCAQDNKIYALCTNSPYVSADNGGTFSMINNAGLNASILRSMITTSNYIMVSNNNDNIYRKPL